MRIVQNILLVIGVTALGTVLGFFALAFLVASLQRPGGEPWTAGYGQFLGAIFCGVPVGTLVGLVASVYWIVRRAERRAWGWAMWSGVLIGAAAGLAATYHWNSRGGLGWWVAVLLMPATGAVGGMLASVTLAIRAAAGDSRPELRKPRTRRR